MALDVTRVRKLLTLDLDNPLSRRDPAPAAWELVDRLSNEHHEGRDG